MIYMSNFSLKKLRKFVDTLIYITKLRKLFCLGHVAQWLVHPTSVMHTRDIGITQVRILAWLFLPKQLTFFRELRF